MKEVIGEVLFTAAISALLAVIIWNIAKTPEMPKDKSLTEQANELSAEASRRAKSVTLRR